MPWKTDDGLRALADRLRARPDARGARYVQYLACGLATLNTTRGLKRPFTRTRPELSCHPLGDIGQNLVPPKA